MKTKMRKSNLTKEPPPRLAGHEGHVERVNTPGTFKIMDERDEARREGEFRETVFPALSTEGYNPPAYVNIMKGKASLTKPTALFPRDSVTNPHPVRFGCKGLQNCPMLDLADAWLTWCGIGADAEPAARVDTGKPAKHRFKHHYAKKLHLKKCCVLACLVYAAIGVAYLSPLYKRADVLPAKLPRHGDSPQVEIYTERSPRVPIPRKRLRGVRIPLLQETRHPGVPLFASNTSVTSLAHRQFASKLVRPTRFRWYGKAQLRRFLTALTGSVEELQPVKGRTGTSV